MQIGEVNRRPRWAIERRDIGFELNQVAGCEARCKTKMAHDLHHQPSRIATGTELEFQRLFRRLHTSFHTHYISNILLHALINTDQHVDGAKFLA